MADQGSEGLLSSFLRGWRKKAAVSFLKGKVLDVGCGNGHLADQVTAELYLGVEKDEETRSLAEMNYPEHSFLAELPPAEPIYDSVAALAVLEHLPDPLHFLRQLVSRLSNDPQSRIILTTPHPWTDSMHKAGARIGLFSKEASLEHQALLDYSSMNRIASECGLDIIHYRRFLLGANQLFILKKSQ